MAGHSTKKTSATRAAQHWKRRGNKRIQPQSLYWPLQKLHCAVQVLLVQKLDVRMQELRLGELGVDTGYKSEKDRARQRMRQTSAYLAKKKED